MGASKSSRVGWKPRSPPPVQLRVLQRGEQHEAPGHSDALASFLRARAQADAAADPRCWMVAERDGAFVGWVWLDKLYEDFFAIGELVVVGWRNPLERLLCGAAVLDATVRAFAKCRLEASTWANEKDPFLENLLRTPRENGAFQLYIEKLYVKRSLLGYQPPTPDPFTGLPVSDAGEEALTRCFAEALSVSRSRDLRTQDPVFEMQELRALEGDAHRPHLWELTLLDGEIIGLILGFRFPSGPREATVSFIGTNAAGRGRGLGRMLHARALTMLAADGADTYLCSTDVQNLPMIALYKANDCLPFGLRRQWTWTPSQRAP